MAEFCIRIAVELVLKYFFTILIPISNNIFVQIRNILDSYRVKKGKFSLLHELFTRVSNVDCEAGPSEAAKE